MLSQKLALAAAGNAAAATYVDDVFSTYVYVGSGSTLTINNGIDLSGEGEWFGLPDVQSQPAIKCSGRLILKEEEANTLRLI